jgi:hypothetical protein
MCDRPGTLPMFSFERSEARGRKIIIRPSYFRLAKQYYFTLYKIVEHTKLLIKQFSLRLIKIKFHYRIENINLKLHY